MSGDYGDGSSGGDEISMESDSDSRQLIMDFLEKNNLRSVSAVVQAVANIPWGGGIMATILFRL